MLCLWRLVAQPDAMDETKPQTKPRRGPGRPFAKGNPGGPGRKPRAVEEQYLTRLRTTMTLDDFADCVRSMVRRAKDGDVAAFRELCRWVLPQTPPPAEPPPIEAPEIIGLA